MQQANLEGANLSRADLSGADLTGAKMCLAMLLGATVDTKTKFSADPELWKGAMVDESLFKRLKGQCDSLTSQPTPSQGLVRVSTQTKDESNSKACFWGSGPVYQSNEDVRRATVLQGLASSGRPTYENLQHGFVETDRPRVV